jgi:hypothetical protein
LIALTVVLPIICLAARKDGQFSPRSKPTGGFMDDMVINSAIGMLENAGYIVIRKPHKNGFQLTVTKDSQDTETSFYYPDREIDSFFIIE